MAEHSKSKSTGGFYRSDVSPCTAVQFIQETSYLALGRRMLPVSSLFSFILQGFSNSLEYLATLPQTLARGIKRANERGTVFDDV